MKKSKQVVIGLLGLILLLLVSGVFATIRASTLEKRLSRLEASYQELRERHRTLVSTMLHADDSPLATAHAKVELLRQSLDLPAATIVETRPAVTKVNSAPRVVTTK